MLIDFYGYKKDLLLLYSNRSNSTNCSYYYLVTKDWWDNNIYGYQEREICPGENWTIPDTRSSINLCTFTEIPWDILLVIDEFYGRRTNLTFEYQWIPVLETSAPVIAPSDLPSITLSNLPINVQTDSPTAPPTIDTCNNCTISGFISGGMYENIVLFLLSLLSISYQTLGEWELTAFLWRCMWYYCNWKQFVTTSDKHTRTFT